MPNFADRLWEAFEPFQNSDNLGHLRIFCDAIGAMFQPVEDLAGDTDDGYAGWTIILDVDRIPAAYLGYIAQFVGKRLKSGLTDAQQRERIKGTDGFDRGRPAAIIAAAQQHLTGNKNVILRERDGSPWRYTVITYAAQTPDPAQTYQDLLEQKPGPDILNYENLSGEDWQAVLDGTSDWDAVRAQFATWQGVKDNTPGQ